MIGWVDNKDYDNICRLNVFNNIDKIDTSIAFSEARSKIEYLIPEFIKYISGDRTKSKIYGQIKRFYTEEVIYLNNNVLDHNIDNLENMDTIIENSSNLTKDLRVVIIKDPLRLTNISGYEFITYNRNGNHINTLFIEDKSFDIKFIFSICLKLFDNVLTSYLHEIGVPINNNIIALNYNGNNSTGIAKFIVDYMYELLYPFCKSLKIESDDEMDAILKHISNSNFSVIPINDIEDIYNLISKTLRGRADNYDYIGEIIKIKEYIEMNQSLQNLPF